MSSRRAADVTPPMDPFMAKAFTALLLAAASSNCECEVCKIAERIVSHLKREMLA